MALDKPLTALEDATLRFVLSTARESDGWLDLTRISSRTGRMLPDVQRAVSRLARRGYVTLDEKARSGDRWIRFLVPGVSEAGASTPPAIHREDPVP
jgi:hypothetical protein